MKDILRNPMPKDIASPQMASYFGSPSSSISLPVNIFLISYLKSFLFLNACCFAFICW